MRKHIISLVVSVVTICGIAFNYDYFEKLLTQISDAAMELVDDGTGAAVEELESELDDLKAEKFFIIEETESTQEETDESGSSSLDEKINQAIMAQENANEIAKSYNGKSVASNGETNTLSGWGKYNDPDNLIDRSVTPQDVINKSAEIGHDLQVNSFLDNQRSGGLPGQAKASHAEKQLSLISDKPIGVASIDMCSDCQKYFSKLSIYENKAYVVADPSTVRIFNPDGTVTEIKR